MRFDCGYDDWGAIFIVKTLGKLLGEMVFPDRLFELRGNRIRADSSITKTGPTTPPTPPTPPALAAIRDLETRSQRNQSWWILWYRETYGG